ncbi:trypsin-like peptidase domain-containing protein [Pseudofulvimonas gallinarii]|uniref:Trypsin-like peptidase n=1 Tax=Pseudofulvimonas gallinarii TaxID=634155 RepID=A0A4R3LD04_9GAMM|nr:trypsin-like peptidase domain-containing protein [Pseudofulvimonas gallinarii]TCS97185.1 trypsin-like peptidase [Pseudofulvimonas gallinarii]THD12540.1 hypothetical protein B1808_12455 [Pseudofulvimonas gallinarii]
MTAQVFDAIDQLGVFQVYTGNGTGTGFLIDERHLLTNSHVVAPYREVAVEMRDRSRVLGTVRRVHPRRDLAIVELERPMTERVLELADEDVQRAKQPVHILGFPVGLPLSLTEGVVSHPRQLLDDQVFIQTDAAINPGNSGGPMLDDAQRVVAVTCSKLDAAESVGFGIPVADVRAFIAGFRTQTEAFGLHCPACEELIAQPTRHCPNCGTRLDEHDDCGDFFRSPDLQPVSEFVEAALRAADINPVLARHGELSWSFYRGSALVRIFCCCADHVNFSCRLAQPGRSGLRELFAHLLSHEHAPFFFDLNGSIIRFNHVVHMADVFTPSEHPALIARVGEFIARADAADDILIERFGCQPAPDTMIDRLDSPDHGA